MEVEVGWAVNVVTVTINMCWSLAFVTAVHQGAEMQEWLESPASTDCSENINTKKLGHTNQVTVPGHKVSLNQLSTPLLILNVPFKETSTWKP